MPVPLGSVGGAVLFVFLEKPDSDGVHICASVDAEALGCPLPATHLLCSFVFAAYFSHGWGWGSSCGGI